MSDAPSLEGTVMNTPTVATRLLATKLHLPAARPTAVTRPRLVARLLAGLRTRLTLVAAPAGFGKSTLLAQALAEARDTAPPQHFAWVALDPGDNDPARFWTYVLTAIERSSPGVGAPPLAVLQASPTAVEAALAELLNELADRPEDIVLLLDDYHAITTAAIHQGINFLLEHAPPQFHLVLASRVDPPLPLARWRVRGELVELRAADLRFTTEEALRFLADTMGLRVDARAAATLEARTEGWAAGLQLAALSLQGQEDVQGFIESFSGSHRHVVDYLVEEVLGRLPDHIRTFLLQTSVLDRLSGPLCDAVLGVADAQVSTDSYSRLVLDTLERDNLFLIALDSERRWFRYHHLFADLLRHRLRHEHPALVAELHRRAARWFEDQGALGEAMEHALSSGDIDLVARLLSTHGERFAARGETHTLQHWLDRLPREAVLGNPQLCLVQAQVLFLNRQVAAMQPYMQAVEAAIAGRSDADATALRGELLVQQAHVAVERGAFAETLRLAREALNVLPATAQLARTTIGLAHGYALMVLGHTREAIAVHEENVRLCRVAGNALSGIFSGNEVGKLLALEGRLREARAALERALAWVAAEGWQHLPPAGALHTWFGHILIEQGELDAADAELRTAVELAERGPDLIRARSHVFMARIRQLQGDTATALAEAVTVDEICRTWESGGERTFFAAYTARIRLLQGDVTAARRWAAERTAWDPGEQPSYFREIELLTLARIAVLAEPTETIASRVTEVRELLAWLRDHARSGERASVVIETLAVEALALARCGDMAEAHTRLNEALTLAAPESFVGVFLDLGSAMAVLLAQHLARRAPVDPLRPYLTHLLSYFAPHEGAEPPPLPVAEVADRPARSSGAGGVETLTERELEVLRLYAAGMTSTEIAQHFVVSINTVKTQLKSIYSKLGAHSRAEVVAHARERRLLT
jgi:LuxR family transcriptional regulator, maltose regulon positive regulatory protein